MTEKLSRSQEDYLEEIYNQVVKNGYAKVTEISNSLNVKKASVTGALNTLSAKKLINYEPYSKITLTKTGEDFARTIHEKHENLREFFENVLGLSKDEASEKKHENLREFFENVLGLSKDEASDNACRMEHIVSEKFFTNFVKFSDFIRDYSKQNPDFIRQYKKMIK